MNIKQIITKYLNDRGYDGLCNLDMECGCESSDDFPCEIIDGSCVPARKKKATADDIDGENGLDLEIGDDIFVPVEGESK